MKKLLKKRSLYNWREYLGLKIWQKFLLTIIIFSILAYFLNFSYDFSAIFTTSSFLFSILIGFFISSAMNNFTSLKSLVSQETGGLVALYRLVLMIDTKLGIKIGDTIEKYIIARFDWELENYIDNTGKEFYKIFDVLKEKNSAPEDIKEEDALYFVFNSLATLPGIRNEIAIVGKSTLNTVYWGLLNTLGLTVIIGIFGSVGGDFIQKLSVALLSSCVAIVLLLLNDIDKNKLNEFDVAFQRYNQALLAIGKLPYYLEVDISHKRLQAPIKGKYQLGVYTNFPYSFEKEIYIVDAKTQKRKLKA